MKHPIIAVCLSVALPVLGSHNRGGEIRYEHLQGATYRIEIHHYTCLNAPSDRPELVLDLGDGTVDTIPRTSFVDDPAAGCCPVRHSFYTTTHDYPNLGVYTIRYDDQNRSAGIVNIPNSVTQSFCVSATLVVSATGPNNSVRFENSQLEFGYVWSTLVHDPRPVDPDGDSLGFELVTPLGLDCLPIAGYSGPSSPSPGWAGLDPALGVYRWHLPGMIGMYTIAIRASEWRKVNGVWANVGQMTRDMLLCIGTLPTGIAQWAGTTGLRAYPTMTDGSLRVDNGTGGPLVTMLIDATGRVLRTFTVPTEGASCDFSALAPGGYVLTARDRTGALHAMRFVRR